MSDRIEDWGKAPDYYRFPNYVQVVDISEHLTSNGGQIIQYVARSTRLDGDNKGEQIKDLAKARRLLEREIRRLESSEGDLPLTKVDQAFAQARLEESVRSLIAFPQRYAVGEDPPGSDPSDGPWADGGCDCGGE